jgi:hypothetical protein
MDTKNHPDFELNLEHPRKNEILKLIKTTTATVRETCKFEPDIKNSWISSADDILSKPSNHKHRKRNSCVLFMWPKINCKNIKTRPGATTTILQKMRVDVCIYTFLYTHETYAKQKNDREDIAKLTVVGFLLTFFSKQIF